MAEEEQPARACPECRSGDYAFRGRRQIEATAGQVAMLETKYRCKGCGHEWKERVPGVLKRAAPGPEQGTGDRGGRGC
jgi:rubredoxin